MVNSVGWYLVESVFVCEQIHSWSIYIYEHFLWHVTLYSQSI